MDKRVVMFLVAVFLSAASILLTETGGGTMQQTICWYSLGNALVVGLLLTMTAFLANAAVALPT